MAGNEACDDRLHTLELSFEALDGFNVADIFGGSLFFSFFGIILILLLGRLALLLLIFGLLVDCLEGFLLSSLSISNSLLFAFLNFSILNLGLFGDLLVHFCMLLGLLYDLLGLNLGVI